MKIRTRISVWILSYFLLSLVFMFGVLYFELIIERRNQIQRGAPVDSIHEAMLEVVGFYGLPTAGFLLVGCWFITRKALAPLDHLIEKANQIHVSNLHERIVSDGSGDELDRLAEVLNAMMTRLEASVASIHQFSLNASHELKTPLAILHGEFETHLNDPNLQPGIRDAFSSHLDEIQRLTRIVESLTLLTQADSGILVLRREPMRLDELLKDCFEDAQILAQPNAIEVRLVRCDPCRLLGDRHRIRQLLLNLMDNAIKHNEANGWVTLELRVQDSTATLVFENSGMGVSPEDLPSIFDRFFRCQQRAEKVTEGCGLGLSIAQWIAHSHDGSIDLQSTMNEKTTVRVILPCLPVQEEKTDERAGEG